MKKLRLLVLCILCFSLTGCARLDEYNDYCKAALEIRYQNDASNYKEMEDVKAIDESFHDFAIIEMADTFLNDLRVDQDKVSGELVDYFHYQVEKLYKNTKVVSTSCKLKGNELNVNVKYAPFDLSSFKTRMDELQFAYNKTVHSLKKISLQTSYQLETVYMTSVIECFDQYLKNIQYLPYETISIKVSNQDGIYTIDNQQLYTLDKFILGYNQ